MKLKQLKTKINMNNLTKTIETLRANHPYCTIILIEPQGDKAVVSADFVLPEFWYVENFDKATEWVKGVNPLKGGDMRSESPAIRSDKYGFDPESYISHRYTKITKQQFIDHVYLPWKESQEWPPKFNPETADKTKMYFAVHKEHGEGTVSFYRGTESWTFDNSEAVGESIENCTHIDHEPIQRRN